MATSANPPQTLQQPGRLLALLEEVSGEPILAVARTLAAQPRWTVKRLRRGAQRLQNVAEDGQDGAQLGDAEEAAGALLGAFYAARAVLQAGRAAAWRGPAARSGAHGD
jgi:hypothetical protein